MGNTLNGKDLKNVFGAVITGGTASLLAYPKRKASYETNWDDEDGDDIDIADPKFEARVFTLNVSVVGNGLDDFNSKYNALFTELKQGGTHELYIEDHDRTYVLYYQNQQNLSKVTRSLQLSKAGVKFDLLLSETNPNNNIIPVYLTDDQDRFLTA
jgi:hypothetical protein